MIYLGYALILIGALSGSRAVLMSRALPDKISVAEEFVLYPIVIAAYAWPAMLGFICVAAGRK